MSDLVLIGYSLSVYSRAVRLAIQATGTSFKWVEVNPFDPTSPVSDYHPFGRVPVLLHGDLRVFETAAILTYVDAAFGAGLPRDPVVQARIAQVSAIVDNYAYWPLVRQVFVEGVLAPSTGRPPDADALDEGMEAAPRILDSLEEITTEGHVLDARAPGRADWHLAPMMDLFARYPPAAAALAKRRVLARWFETMRSNALFVETAPVGLPLEPSVRLMT